MTDGYGKLKEEEDQHSTTRRVLTSYVKTCPRMQRTKRTRYSYIPSLFLSSPSGGINRSLCASKAKMFTAMNIPFTNPPMNPSNHPSNQTSMFHEAALYIYLYIIIYISKILVNICIVYYIIKRVNIY